MDNIQPSCASFLQICLRAFLTIFVVVVLWVRAFGELDAVHMVSIWRTSPTTSAVLLERILL